MDDVDKFYVWFKNKKDNEWSFCTDIKGEGGPFFYGWQYRPNNSKFINKLSQKNTQSLAGYMNGSKIFNLFRRY